MNRPEEMNGRRMMNPSLLDQERKQELILAKQVRQGTVVILGGNLVRDSSPFVHYDQCSRDLKKKIVRTKMIVSSPSPNPEAIKKASNPIALRYWNQCMQQSNVSPSEPSMPSRPPPSETSVPSRPPPSEISVPSRPPPSETLVPSRPPPQEQYVPGRPPPPELSSPNRPPEPSGQSKPPKSELPIATSLNHDISVHTMEYSFKPFPSQVAMNPSPGGSCREDSSPRDVPPPWLSLDYKAEPLTLLSNSKLQQRRETRKTVIVRAQTRSSSLPPWTRGGSLQTLQTQAPVQTPPVEERSINSPRGATMSAVGKKTCLKSVEPPALTQHHAGGVCDSTPPGPGRLGSPAVDRRTANFSRVNNGSAGLTGYSSPPPQNQPFYKRVLSPVFNTELYQTNDAPVRLQTMYSEPQPCSNRSMSPGVHLQNQPKPFSNRSMSPRVHLQNQSQHCYTRGVSPSRVGPQFDPSGGYRSRTPWVRQAPQTPYSFTLGKLAA